MKKFVFFCFTDTQLLDREAQHRAIMGQVFLVAIKTHKKKKIASNKT